MESIDPEITVLGAGFVGLITTVGCLASGHKVTCFEIDSKRRDSLIQSWNQNRVGHFPADVSYAADRLSFPADSQAALSQANTVFVCVDTPQGTTGAADLNSLNIAISDAFTHCAKGAVVCVRSTVPPGTLRDIQSNYKELVRQKDLRLVAFPEFHPSYTDYEAAQNIEHVFIGILNENDAAEVRSRLGKIYNKAQITLMSAESAELSKYASNAFLTAKVLFISEMARLSDSLPNTDIIDVITSLQTDPRIGKGHLDPRAGVGGHCLPKDLKALLALKGKQTPLPLLESLLPANNTHQQAIVQRVLSLCEVPSGTALSVAILCDADATLPKRLLASTAYSIGRFLAELGVNVRLYSTKGSCTQEELNAFNSQAAYRDVSGEVSVDISDTSGSLNLIEDPYEAARDCHAVILIFDSSDTMRDIDPKVIATVVKQQNVFDLTRSEILGLWRAAGFAIHSLGQENSSQTVSRP